MYVYEIVMLSLINLLMLLIGWLLSRNDFVLYIKKDKNGKYEYIKEKEMEVKK